MLINFNAEPVFTKVPISETVDKIKECFDSNLPEIAEMCHRFTYFRIDDMHYKQLDGAALSYPVLLVGANLYMEIFEKKDWIGRAKANNVFTLRTTITLKRKSMLKDVLLRIGYVDAEITICLLYTSRCV